MAPPIYVKGGAWTNVEDQILRAAVSKYGLTQWARVSSLLPKKTAKQAKARWNEYLNPTINRTEWTPQEDEKLLNLTKLLLNQWRSIASVMERTATHCLERYQKLLDDALNDGVDDDNKVEIGLTGPGIEALPALGNAFESLPSRPDMKKMDDDEAEMLSEATARLANMQGKKAKRKERERLLEESRRLALLQKRRELKAAGINISLVLQNKRRRKEFDYGTDIPHEHQPPPGLHDTSKEDPQNASEQANFHKSVNLKEIVVEERSLKRKTKDDNRENMRVKKSILDAAGAVSGVAKYQLEKRQDFKLPGLCEVGAEEEFKKRILQKPGESLSDLGVGLQATTSGAKHVIQLSKAAKKQMIFFLKEQLAKLPPPKNEKRPSVPPVGLATSFETKERHLWLFDGRYTRKRQSLVVQKGYSIPRPSTVCNVPNSLTELEKAIYKELQQLLTSDYVQFVNPAHDGSVVDGISEEEWKFQESQVRQELESGPKKDYEPLALARDPRVVDKAIELLVRLDAQAAAAEKVVEEVFAATDAGINQVCQTIQDQFEEFSEACVNLQLHENISRDEIAALALRCARLHKLVEEIKAADQRVEARV
ncbi:hypothetical protein METBISCDRAFT_28356 [Metschnikowia bicuspidata]|uniref:Pre-mRNA-splicing factor CEF1 n=1 Tax=Metschnikowia bicuspidata TaxID=27322 RepID=A0A4P9ZAE4_9ASCO|nr:hypothetical protein METBISCDRAFT_28356 [Metschnikowia bicuspidata]